MKIQALITVREHGYTGQRDQLEDISKERVVELDGDIVRILMDRATSRTVEFDRSEFIQAIAVLTPKA